MKVLDISFYKIYKLMKIFNNPTPVISGSMLLIVPCIMPYVRFLHYLQNIAAIDKINEWIVLAPLFSAVAIIALYFNHKKRYIEVIERYESLSDELQSKTDKIFYILYLTLILLGIVLILI